MITFLTRTMRQDPLLILTRDWSKALGGKVFIREYTELPTLAEIEPGAFVFTGVDEIVGAERELACRFAQRIDTSDGRFAILNDPRHALPRYELLSELHEKGVNDFRAYRCDALPDRLRIPVFLRRDRAHTANLSGIIDSIDVLRQQVRRLRWSPRRFTFSDLIAVEFLDTCSPDGLYRKYAVTRVGDELIPRHVLFSQNWVTKFPDRVEAELAEEEREFLDAFPHRDAVMNAFDVAGIQYGRIDYGLLDGRVQVWEINTNPLMSPPLHRFAVTRRGRQRRVMAGLIRAIDGLDADLSGQPLRRVFTRADLPVTVPARLRAAVRKCSVRAYRRIGLKIKG